MPGNKEEAYADQLLYISTRVIELVEKIIADSDQPPIIILQSDHGIQMANQVELMKILNAYYLPNFDVEDIPQDISPVNTFRIILTTYLGTEYPLLENTSYSSLIQKPYDFTVIYDDRPGCDPGNGSE